MQAFLVDLVNRSSDLTVRNWAAFFKNFKHFSIFEKLKSVKNTKTSS